MIKSKIEAREKAMELAVPLAIALLNGNDSVNLVSLADEIKDYIIGDAELPETQSDTELVKAFLEVMNSELDKKCKPMPDYAEMLRTVQTGNAGVSAEIPCKSEVE